MALEPLFQTSAPFRAHVTGIPDGLTGGGGGLARSGPLTHPPPPHQKHCPEAKNEMDQRGRTFEADFRDANFFLASDPPPPILPTKQRPAPHPHTQPTQ